MDTLGDQSVLARNAGDSCPSIPAVENATNHVFSAPASAGEARRRTCVAVIDEYAFTRECISRSLQEANTDISVAAFANFQEALHCDAGTDVLLFHWHCRDADAKTLGDQLLPLKNNQILTPVLLLSSVECPETVINSFQSGISGYVPTGDTSLKLLVEIIHLVRAGGTFVPMIGLPRKPANGHGELPLPAEGTFTIRERAVLNLLKNGKANKIIAHELSLSESTVKVHVRNIMRKMKARNRTEAVSRVYTANITSSLAAV